jgi:hypothetical protein
MFSVQVQSGGRAYQPKNGPDPDCAVLPRLRPPALHLWARRVKIEYLG